MNDSIIYLTNLESRGIKLGLERTKLLMDEIGNPHKKLKCIQIAGTNGKGSVAAMISKGLINLGFNVGLFTSPHLVNINERIRINGKPITNNELKQIINSFKYKIEKTKATFFESITAIAFYYFKKKKTDFAILETGLGGRFDSVTICKPLLTVMTSISMDHSEILGNSIQTIAKEKAGIIKHKIPLISVEQKKAVKKIINKAVNKQSTSVKYCKSKNNINLEYLKGNHQKKNAEVALYSILYLYKNKISNNKIINEIKKTKWYGRYQIINYNPLIIFDVAHNNESILAFIKEYKTEDIKGNKYLIIALQKTKKINKCIKKINNNFDIIVCTETKKRNYMSARALKKIIHSEKTKVIDSPEEAINKIKTSLGKKDSLAILGSHYLGKHIKKEFKISFDKL